MSKADFVKEAKEGRILTHKCSGCGRLHLSTVRFCAGCGGGGFEAHPVQGTGKIATYTIITVPPAGFERHAPYAWAVLEIDGQALRVSGFMAGIGSPEDLPIGSRARVAGFDERGVLLERLK